MAKATRAYLNQIRCTIAMLAGLPETMPMSEVLNDQDGHLARFDGEGNLQKMSVPHAIESVKAMRSCLVGTMIRNLTRMLAGLEAQAVPNRKPAEPPAKTPDPNRARRSKKKSRV